MCNEIKLSVIVPVYNTEKYLTECLDSIFNQTFKDFEVICVDDGSIDGSLKILNDYKLNHQNLIVLSQQNRGVSVARNLGLKTAKGEYITFIDSDDFIRPNMFEALINETKNDDYDIVWCGTSLYYQDDNVYINADERLYINALKLTNGYLMGAENVFCSLWYIGGRFYKANLLKLNHITFPEKMHYAEDCYFYKRALIYAKRIKIIPDNYYIYRRQRTGQATSILDNKYFSCIDIIKKLRAEILTNNMPNLIPYLNFIGMNFICSGYLNIPIECKRNYYKQFCELSTLCHITPFNIAYPKLKDDIYNFLKYTPTKVTNLLILLSFKLNNKTLFDFAMCLKALRFNIQSKQKKH